MFFTAKTFQEVLPQSLAETVAKICNEKLASSGRTLFGKVFDGEATQDKRDVFKDFTSYQKENDNYKAYVLLYQQLGIYDSEDLPLKIERASESELVEAINQKAEFLDRENKLLRKRNGLEK